MEKPTDRKTAQARHHCTPCRDGGPVKVKVLRIRHYHQHRRNSNENGAIASNVEFLDASKARRAASAASDRAFGFTDAGSRTGFGVLVTSGV